MVVEKPTKLVETLAFYLWSMSDRDKADTSPEEMTLWRDPSQKADRNSYRILAVNLLDSLSEAGVRVTVQKPALTDAFITRLITQPAVATYKPEDDQ